MRALFAAILILALGGAIAAGAYEAGLTQSGAQIVIPAGTAAAPPAAGAPIVAYYGHPYGWGFHPFGFLFPLLGLFLFFGLMRALVGGGRGRGHHGWHGDGVPGRFEEWHRQAHGATGPTNDHPASPHQ